MMQTKQLNVPLQIKAVEESGEFSGYGSVFGVKDRHDDIVVKGAFIDSLDDWKTKGRFPAMLWQHDTKEPIGVYTEMKEDSEGLYFEGRLLIDADPQAKRAHAHLKAGSLSGMSIGYNLVDDGWRYDSEKDAFILSKIDLWELSLVTFPTNDEARVQDVKRAFESGSIPDEKLVERLLRDAGFSRQQAKAVMCKGYSGIGQREADNDVECIKAAQSIIDRLRQ
ncbi:MAG: HK97 family phage prohead protease [Planctomycetaceae bacterium]|nr:HK97 family phage prohead protease [Planctomycetaceae bacterium]